MHLTLRLTLRPSGVGRQRQAHGHLQPRLRVAQGQGAAVRRHQPAQVQAQADATGAALARGVGSVQSLRKALELRCLDPQPVVANVYVKRQTPIPRWLSA